jgi:hypothetical protein
MRIGTVLATAAAVIAAAGLTVLGHDPAPVPTGVTGTIRRPAQRTLVLGPGTGFSSAQFVTEATRQQLTVRDDRSEARIVVYDPGSFEVSTVTGGRTVRLGGHDAIYVRTPTALLAWRSPAGAWVTVSGPVDQVTLFRLARAVRLDQPTPVTGPVGLTRLPTGLVLTSARIGDGTASLTLTARGRRTYDVRLEVYPVAGNDWTNGTLGLGTPTTTVAGHAAWYSETGPDGSQLLLEAGTCGLRVQVSDRDRVPPAALTALIGGATIGSCTSANGWRPILS